MRSLPGLCWTFLIFLPGFALAAEPSTADAASTHKKVQAALDWELPENACTEPKAPGFRQEVQDEQGSTVERWDVDSYTLNRYERKRKRWQKCVDRYKARLENDFAALKDSAQYGLTKEQADIILGKMKLIQTVLTSPDGTLAGVVTPQ